MSMIKATADLMKKYGRRAGREASNTGNQVGRSARRAEEALSKASPTYKSSKDAVKKAWEDSPFAQDALSGAAKVTGMKFTGAEARLAKSLTKKLDAAKAKIAGIKKSDYSDDAYKAIVKKHATVVESAEESLKMLKAGKTARQVISGSAAGLVGYSAMSDDK